MTMMLEDTTTTQGAEIARVKSKLGPAIEAYYKEFGAGHVFHAADLVEYVDRHTANDNAPASAQRILQIARLEGLVDYLVINRRESEYQLVALGTSDYSKGIKKAQPSGLVKMPPGVDLDLNLYLVSDKEGHEICYTVHGLTTFVDKMLDAVDLDHLKTQGVLPPIADDWRVMTPAEVADYRKRERDES